MPLALSLAAESGGPAVGAVQGLTGALLALPALALQDGAAAVLSPRWGRGDGRKERKGGVRSRTMHQWPCPFVQVLARAPGSNTRQRNGRVVFEPGLWVRPHSSGNDSCKPRGIATCPNPVTAAACTYRTQADGGGGVGPGPLGRHLPVPRGGRGAARRPGGRLRDPWVRPRGGSRGRGSGGDRRAGGRRGRGAAGGRRRRAGRGGGGWAGAVGCHVPGGVPGGGGAAYGGGFDFASRYYHVYTNRAALFGMLRVHHANKPPPPCTWWYTELERRIALRKPPTSAARTRCCLTPPSNLPSLPTPPRFHQVCTVLLPVLSRRRSLCCVLLDAGSWAELCGAFAARRPQLTAGLAPKLQRWLSQVGWAGGSTGWGEDRDVDGRGCRTRLLPFLRRVHVPISCT